MWNSIVESLIVPLICKAFVWVVQRAWAKRGYVLDCVMCGDFVGRSDSSAVCKFCKHGIHTLATGK